MNPTNMSAKLLELVSLFADWDDDAGVWHFELPRRSPSIVLEGADWFDLMVEFHQFINEQGLKFNQISLPHDGTLTVLGLAFAPLNAPIYDTLHYHSNVFAAAA